jgi:hypothetical protein
MLNLLGHRNVVSGNTFAVRGRLRRFSLYAFLHGMVEEIGHEGILHNYHHPFIPR